jgi:hypothetical protein
MNETARDREPHQAPAIMGDAAGDLFKVRNGHLESQ